MKKQNIQKNNSNIYSANKIVDFLKDVFPGAKKEELATYVKNPTFKTTMLIYSGVCL